MKLKYLLFLGLAFLTFSCGDDEKDNNPQPASNTATNDNSKIEGDWTVMRMVFTEYDSQGNSLGEWYSSISTGTNNYYRFKPQGIFEDSYLDNGKFEILEAGTFNLKKNVLTVSLPKDETHLDIHAGTYTVDTLTASKLTFIDTTGNPLNHSGVKYGIFRYSLLK